MQFNAFFSYIFWNEWENISLDIHNKVTLRCTVACLSLVGVWELIYVNPHPHPQYWDWEQVVVVLLSNRLGDEETSTYMLLTHPNRNPNPTRYIPHHITASLETCMSRRGRGSWRRQQNHCYFSTTTMSGSTDTEQSRLLAQRAGWPSLAIRKWFWRQNN